MLYNQCKHCGNPVRYPSRVCEACTDKEEQRQEELLRRRNRKYNSQRSPKYKRFYNSIEWRQLSAAYMQDRRYQCEQCNGLATEVHHIKPIQTSEGWKLRFDWDNLMSVCVTCHNKLHGRF